MAECNHDCSNCSSKCSKESFLEPGNKASNVKRVIGVVSGKGGVGKSLVTSMMAVTMNRRGYKAAILDADITGPSIPKAFGLKGGNIQGSELGMFPAITKTGIEVMSLNLLVDEETKPVVWRGPVIAGTVKQFWSEVVWNEVDFMFVDMPPGTGDVPLTVFQSLPLDGIIIVTSPQELVSMIVEKAVNMASLMDIPVLGLVENYSYIVCPDCGKVIRPYGESKIETLAANYGTEVLAKLPIDTDLASQCDKGLIELFEGEYMERAADIIEKKLVK
ncbi:MAG: Mrp/NBP35 family ATP-binding protein [Ruminococcaceae bacterium]|nr:Mrp/NBP35 family ATP-binding protein [Oscillospiraceae bacterium]